MENTDLNSNVVNKPLVFRMEDFIFFSSPSKLVS